MFNQAVDKDLITRNPFKMVKTKTKSPRRDRLTVHQVAQVQTIDFANYPAQALYVDIFLFSTFTGLRIAMP